MKRLQNTIWLWRRLPAPVASADLGIMQANAWLGAVGTDVPLVVDGRAWHVPAVLPLGDDADGDAIDAALSALADTEAAPPALVEMLNSARGLLNLSAPLLATLEGPWPLVRDALGKHLNAAAKEHGDKLAAAVAALAERLADAAGSLVAADIDGLVLCAGDGRWSRAMKSADYDAAVAPAEQAALAAVRDAGKLAVVQLVDEPEDFQRFARYPCDAVAWADRRHPPSLAYARDRVGPALIGGLSSDVVAGGDPAAVREQADDARRQAGEHPLVLGVGEPLKAAPAGGLRF